jgi:hypothetical protein
LIIQRGRFHPPPFLEVKEDDSIEHEALDALSGKCGKHTLQLGASHAIEVQGKGRPERPESSRTDATLRRNPTQALCHLADKGKGHGKFREVRIIFL